jgi:tetratricopeptide (TPR) repeat protein
VSLKKFSLQHFIATGLLVVAWNAQQPCRAQFPTPAPADEPAALSELPQKPEINDPIDIFYLMEEAEEAFNEKDFTKAVELLQEALLNAESEDAKRNIKTLFASSLVMNEEYLDALHILNDLGKSNPDAGLRLMRAGALFRAGWRDAVLDQLRCDLRLDPSNPQLRKAFADALLSSPISTELDAYDALSVLMPLADGIEEEPRIAGAIAMSAARAGNFELAVEMQERYLESLDRSGKQRESETLSRYKAKQVSAPVPFPAWEPAKLLSNQEIATIAHKSTVMVRIIRDIELTETETGENAGLATTKSTHLGTVLSSMGTILISSETVRMPHFDDFYTPNVLGTAKLTKEEIEVFTMPDEFGISQSLGLAQVQGIDEQSGLAVLELAHQEHFEHVKRDELSTIRFMPEYRLLDPNTKRHLSKLFEYSVESGSKTNKPSLREVNADLNKISVYVEPTIEAPTIAKLAVVSGSESPVGMPVFNQLGECVGITHSVNFDDMQQTVIIPSAVCSRIAAKLTASGVVHRASLPMVVHGMLTGVREPQTSMRVFSVTSNDPILKSLEGTTIVGVHGIPTPTLTEWLMVLERAYALGLKSLVLEIQDNQNESTTCLEVPVSQ